MEEYISVSEYARKEGISVQAVYKRLNSSLKQYLIIKNGKKYINTSCFMENSSSKSLNEDLNIINILNNQLKEKDKQIEALQRQNEALTNALTAAQALHAGTMQEIKEISVNEDKASSDTRGAVQEDHSTGGLLRRLFGRNRRPADN